MTWVKLDDGMPEDEKLLETGALGFAVQVAAICYCNRRRTDGHLPRRAARTLLDTTEYGIDPGTVIQDLLDHGIWHHVGHTCDRCPQPRHRDGYYLHAYLNYQPSAAQLDEQAEQKRQAGQKGGEASARARQRRGQADNGAAAPTPRPAGGGDRSNGSGPPPALAPASPPAQAPAAAGAQAKTNPVPVSRSRIPGSVPEPSSSSRREASKGHAPDGSQPRDDDDDPPSGDPLNGRWRLGIVDPTSRPSWTPVSYTTAVLDRIATGQVDGDPATLHAQAIADHLADLPGQPAVRSGGIHTLRALVLEHTPLQVLTAVHDAATRPDVDKPISYARKTLAGART